MLKELIQSMFRNSKESESFIRLLSHNYITTALNNAPSMAVVGKTPSELIWKHIGWCLLRPLRAD